MTFWGVRPRFETNCFCPNVELHLGSLHFAVRFKSSWIRWPPGGVATKRWRHASFPERGVIAAVLPSPCTHCRRKTIGTVYHRTTMSTVLSQRIDTRLSLWQCGTDRLNVTRLEAPETPCVRQLPIIMFSSIISARPAGSRNKSTQNESYFNISSTVENCRLLLLNLIGQSMARGDRLAELEGEKFDRINSICSAVFVCLTYSKTLIAC